MTTPTLRVAETSGEPDVEPVPIAFLGRTSTVELQDPTLSIPRQVKDVNEKKPDEAAIVAYFWDIESGGLPLEERGQGTNHKLVSVPVPRDGGIQDLLREAASPDRRFAAVMCSGIERSSRDAFDSLKLEKELERLGIPLLAADEPIVFDRSEPNTILLRRLKQGIAEWYRADLRKNVINGLRIHTTQGWNLGRVPYGYVADRVPHPVPAKRAEGRTKTRLVLDPVRSEVVRLMFRWRVDERLGYDRIQNRLNSDLAAYPPPENPNPNMRLGAWSIEAVKTILSNPKYTGYMVWNRRSSRTGTRNKDPKAWTWSSEPTHPEIVSREMYDKAVIVSRVTEGSRQGGRANPHPLTKRTYLFRSFVRCAVCGWRLIGRTDRKIVYYGCSRRRREPRFAELFPDHPHTVQVREDVLQEAVETLFAEHVFGADRRALWAEHANQADDEAHAAYTRRIGSIRTRIDAEEATKRKLIMELEHLPDEEENAAPLRDDIHRRYKERETTRRELLAELAKLESRPPREPDDPGLLDAFPQIPFSLEGVPENIQRDLFNAFDLVIKFDRVREELELSITITDRLADLARDAGQELVSGDVHPDAAFKVLLRPTPWGTPVDAGERRCALRRSPLRHGGAVGGGGHPRIRPLGACSAGPRASVPGRTAGCWRWARTEDLRKRLRARKEGVWSPNCVHVCPDRVQHRVCPRSATCYRP